MNKIRIISLGIIIIFFIISCEEDIDPDNNVLNLEFTFISGNGYSNLMPSVPPDPINISAKFRIENLGKGIVKDVIINDCRVISSDNIGLGKIDIYSDPPINIFPSEIDSLTFYKETSLNKLFDDPCGDSIYLVITLSDKNGNSNEVFTNKFFYGCAY